MLIRRLRMDILLTYPYSEFNFTPFIIYMDLCKVHFRLAVSCVYIVIAICKSTVLLIHIKYVCGHYDLLFAAHRDTFIIKHANISNDNAYVYSQWLYSRLHKSQCVYDALGGVLLTILAEKPDRVTMSFHFYSRRTMVNYKDSYPVLKNIWHINRSCLANGLTKLIKTI